MIPSLLLLLSCASIAFRGLAQGPEELSMSCTAAQSEAGTCTPAAPQEEDFDEAFLLQGNIGALGGIAAKCPASENTDLYVSSCGDGYTSPSWMSSSLDSECVDGLKFGRESGQLCRNTNFNVGKGIIVVHGQNSDRTKMWSQNGGWGNLFLKRGYVVFSIDYRSGDCEKDIKAASAFFQDPANMPSDDFVVEPNNIGLFGFSLGAICSARAAIFESASQQAVVCLSGGAKNSPAKKVHKDVPPTLLLWGNKDCQVDITYGDFWYKKMMNKGLDMTFHVFDGGMQNTHTHVYKEYPCSQEWATDFFDEKLGTTLEAPTPPPTPAPAPTAAVSWEVHFEDSKCKEGGDTKVDGLQACLDLAVANGVPFASFDKKKKKCKAAHAACTLKAKSGWVVYEAMEFPPAVQDEAPTAAPTEPPTEPPTAMVVDAVPELPTEQPTEPPTEMPTMPTEPPTLMPTEPPAEPEAKPEAEAEAAPGEMEPEEEPPMQWTTVAENTWCSGGSAKNVADRAACIAKAEAGGFKFASYRDKNPRCKVSNGCSRKTKKDWVVLEFTTAAP